MFFSDKMGFALHLHRLNPCLLRMRLHVSALTPVKDAIGADCIFELRLTCRINGSSETRLSTRRFPRLGRDLTSPVRFLLSKPAMSFAVPTADHTRRTRNHQLARDAKAGVRLLEPTCSIPNTEILPPRVRELSS